MKKSKSQFDWLLFRRACLGVLCVVFIFLGVAFIQLYTKTNINLKLEKLNNRVYAIYEGAGPAIVIGKFVAWYIYIDLDGTEYTGSSGFFNTKEKADQLVGTKVEIYIDGEGNSIPVKFRNTHYYDISVAALFFVLLMGTVILTIVLETRPKRKKRQLERARQALVEELSKIRAQKEGTEARN